MDAHAEVPAWLERKRAQKAGGGAGSTANQLATNFAPYLDAVGTLPGSVSPGNASLEPKGTVSPIVAPQVQAADPRVLLQTGSQSLYADGE
jgi:hypothetical protein